MLFNLLTTAVEEFVDTTEGAVENAMNNAAPAVQQTLVEDSIFDMFLKGGWLMWVLLILSIFAIYLFGKKWWMIRSAAKIDRNFIDDVKDYLADGKIKSARTLCNRYDTPVARMTEAGINLLDETPDKIQAAMDNAGSIEIARIEKGLPYLATIAGGAPMIGFLGTVIGMVQAFHNMAASEGSVNIAGLAGGIYTAMITTVGGLIVGILAYFAYNFLSSQVSNLVLKMDTCTKQFLTGLTVGEPVAEKPVKKDEEE